MVTFNDGSTISYTYAADGTKLRSVFTSGGTTTQTDYCSNVIYENNVLKRLLTDEGYVDLSGGIAYYYYLKDHQGNNRVVINSSGTVKETNHYYPFGGLFASSNNIQPYKYNGKEYDTRKGLNLYDYGARQYDPTIARWTTQDPMAEKYYPISPYTYCAGNPVNYIDPNGQDPIYTVNLWKKVKWIGDDGAKSDGAYLVMGSVAREVKAATKAGEDYLGDLSESEKVMHIPTRNILSSVQETVESTRNSGDFAGTRVEHGGHSLKGDTDARIWDPGKQMQTKINNEIMEMRWVINAFQINGKHNQIGGKVGDIEFFWHVHPDASKPSTQDYTFAKQMQKFGYSGNFILIGLNQNRVSFYNQNKKIITIPYKMFIRMGHQEAIQ